MQLEEIERFEKNHGLLESIYLEVSTLSKKSPNDKLNEFKLKIINGILAQSNSLLSGSYNPIDGFSSFEIESLPTNSDVTFVCAQYLACLEKLRADNIVIHTFGYWVWVMDDEQSEIRTKPPEKIIKK